ncbi:4Fe-4S binding protein [Sulfurospirillum arcachonense]|uniref:4Fe-4S binding protein n=1 Tax=Sulfurospirillum arcachonense TaxID=57666 RepID=UPI000467F020|nr:4Fe-4S binding protein [Sulfurospirillum arcachonense]
MSVEIYFKILANEIHSVVVATLNKGLPTTRVIDIMLYDKNGIYFLTAKGKAFYEHLKTNPYISLSGLTSGSDSMQRKSITISGYTKDIGSQKLEEIFKKNPYMADIYPSKESRMALNVFHLYKGQGEYFDLSTKPITRTNFVFGGEELKKSGYFITENCKACGKCKEKCPQSCIEIGKIYKINQEQCLHCGNCYEICPNEAIVKLI